MRKIILALMLLISAASFAQSYKISWGDEVKMKKNTADMNVVAADNSGVYFAEEKPRPKGFGGMDMSVTLVKFDKNFDDIFQKDYSKELKGLSYDNIQMLDKDLFMFATDYDRREKSLKLYGAKIDRATGELMGDFTELANYTLESRRDRYNISLDSIENSNNFLMVTDISGKDRTSLAVAVLDSKLKPKISTIINLTYEKSTYSLEDVKYTAGGKIVLLGKVMEHMVSNSGREKRRMVFKEYAMAIYNEKGKKEKDINLSSGNRFVIGGKLIEQPSGELLLAGFYSNEQKKNDLNGFFMNRIDMNKGELLLSSYKDINASMLGDVTEDKEDAATDGEEDDKQSKKDKKKEKGEEEEFPGSFIIRSVKINPADGSYLLTAEISQYSTYTYTTFVPSGPNGMSSMQTTTVHRFTNKDILVIDADQQGIIKWINDVPKYQLEQITSSRARMGFGFSLDGTGYFARAGGLPYYSSFTSLLTNNQLIIVMNDNTKNTGNKEYGNHVKRITNFKKYSTTYGVSIDLVTGAVSRKPISENSEEIILMPRHSYVVNDLVYIPSMRQKVLGKSELKMAKIAVL